MSIVNHDNGQRTQTMTYDSMNRLASAWTTATSGSDCWGVSYTIDEWSNLLAGWPRGWRIHGVFCHVCG